MGNTRRIKKILNKSVCMVKTGVTFAGSEVVLAVDDPVSGKVKADAFRKQVIHTHRRSSVMNLHDMTSIGLLFRDRIMSGEPVWN